MRNDFITHNFTTHQCVMIYCLMILIRTTLLRNSKLKKTPEKMTGVLLFLLTKTGESSQSRTYFVVATYLHFAENSLWLGNLKKNKKLLQK